MEIKEVKSIQYRIGYPDLSIYTIENGKERIPRIVLREKEIEFDGNLYEPAVLGRILEAHTKFVSQPRSFILQAPEEGH